MVSGTDSFIFIFIVPCAWANFSFISSYFKPFVVDAAGSTGQLDLESTESPLRYQLGVHIKLGDGVFSPSKVIQISPRFTMTNEAGCEMSIRQSSSTGLLLSLIIYHLIKGVIQTYLAPLLSSQGRNLGRSV